jgi:hypothetical protein
MANATTNPYNPPLAQETVLSGSGFSFPWYQWFSATVAKVLRAPASSAPPVTSAGAGVPGQIAYDQNFVYVCIQANLWKKIALTAF